MSWLFLVLAGCLEMVGVAMINQWNKRRSWQSLLFLGIGFGLSFLFLSLAMQTLPMGTAYAVWTGIGSAGGALIGMLLYNESRNPLRIVFLALVLGSAVGLKLVS